MTRASATLSTLSRTALILVGTLFVATGALFVVADVDLWTMPLTSIALGSLFLFAGLRGRDPFDLDWSAGRPPSSRLVTTICVLAVLGSPIGLVILAITLSAPATIASGTVAALIAFAPHTTTHGRPYLPISLCLVAGGVANVLFGSGVDSDGTFPILRLVVGVSTGLFVTMFVYAFAVGVFALRLRRFRAGAT